MRKKTVILGAGNWGTTLALEFAHCSSVTLWTQTEKQADLISKGRINKKYLPGIKLPKAIKVEQMFSSPIPKGAWLVLAIPSSKMAEVCHRLRGEVHEGQTVINVSKGVAVNSLTPLSKIIEEKLKNINLAVLSGPTIAREIAAGEPARAVLASKNVETLLELKKSLKLPHLTFEMSRDVEGSELCAALKGIVAIGVGIAEGLGLHANIQSAIMTYGLNEFGTIARFLHVPEKTIYGLSGMGDLITTCISPNSRNRRFGRLLGQGKKRSTALKEVGMVVEGIIMAKSIVELSRFNLNIPLFKALSKIIFQEKRNVRKTLMDTLNGIN